MGGPFLGQGVFAGPVSNIDSVQKEELGSMRWDAGRILQYVKFRGVVAAYEWVGLDTGQSSAYTPYQVLVLPASATQMPLGVSEYGASTNQYGWITKYGPATAKVASAVGAGVPLRAAGTAGTVGGYWGNSPSTMPQVGVTLSTTTAATGSAVLVTCL